ncbi:MFS transporter [uncultured Microbacterium sp.]|uniref:MFS transporter n=1 Tax=uncultured Microbacterium sp. TaxID=191216 RepID=UPI0026253D73|nr:MFS transporter [uncultured Microbacterium sp.]
MTDQVRTDTGGVHAPRAGLRGWLALVVLMLPVLLVSVDNTVLSFALPEIAVALAPTGAQQLWMIDVYPLVLAGLLVSMGTMGDRFGRKRMLLIGSIGFAAVSALAAFAPTAALLIAARALLGFFGAMLMPSTLALLRSTFLNRDQRRLAIAIWATAFSAGSALGPIVGGFLLEHFAWGSVFLLAVPVLVPLLVCAPFLVTESRDPNPGRIDPLSIVLSMATMVPVVYAIKEVATEGIGAVSAVLIVVGVLMGCLFVRRQTRSASPMLDMALFRRGSFSGAILVNLFSVVALVGFMYFVPQHLQLVLGMAPMAAGFALLPAMVAIIISGLVVVPIARRVPPHVIIPAALVFTVVGYLLVSVAAPEQHLAPLIAASVLVGLGIGAAETISNELILSSAPSAKAGAASAVSETAYELGAVLGTAVLGGVITAIYRAVLVVPDGIASQTADAARETLAGAYSAVQDLTEPGASALWAAATEAFESGVAVTSLIGAGLVVLAAVIGAVTLRNPRTR